MKIGLDDKINFKSGDGREFRIIGFCFVSNVQYAILKDWPFNRIAKISELKLPRHLKLVKG